MINLNLEKIPLINLIVFLLFTFIQSCSNTSIGNNLSNSFDNPSQNDYNVKAEDDKKKEILDVKINIEKKHQEKPQIAGLSKNRHHHLFSRKKIRRTHRSILFLDHF